ncbi:MAG: Spy/CpxP family protein refolding chaperone [Acidobacteria bacterium]|nr:Spy/CpxP family protein refolding chaperone [Acidobacteriota bacterium]
MTTKVRKIVAYGAGAMLVGAFTFATVEAAGPGEGRGMRGRQARMRMLGLGPLQELGLSDTQKEQIKGVLASHKTEFRALADRARTARKDLSAAVTAGTIDEELIREKSAALAAVQADLAVMRAKARAELLPILTPQQQEKLSTIRSEFERRMEERVNAARKRRDGDF